MALVQSTQNASSPKDDNNNNIVKDDGIQIVVATQEHRDGKSYDFFTDKGAH
jgi:hypothetical protein